MRSDPAFPYPGIAEAGHTVSANIDLITESIRYIKERKTSKDSLAEELIGICMLIFFRVPGDSERKHFYFCSNDVPALGRMKKIMLTSRGGKSHFKNIHLFSMVQYMIQEDLIKKEEKTEITNAMRQIMGPSVWVTVNVQAPFLSTEEELPIEEFMDNIFDKKEVIFRGKLR